jgi:acetyl/propionyl-CoA carboxylase alpha subunit
MFKKILIANRGEIAVRIARTCREMGIATVALYEHADRHSLHVRLADQAVLLENGFSDAAAVLNIAQDCGADALHPGYGFLAEEPEFIHLCQAAGITFIGPPAEVVENVVDKVTAIERVRAAGHATVQTSGACLGADDYADIDAAAQELGYPVVVKACRAGRGPGERLVRDAGHLAEAVRSALAEAGAVFAHHTLYVEKAILPVHQVSIQILADQHGHVIHLGDREGSLQFGNRKLVEEAPAPCLSPAQRAEVCTSAVAIARLFGYQGAGTVEFLVDARGRAYFSEIKARIQIEHPITESVMRVDLVRKQILIAAGQALNLTQDDVQARGCAVLCRVNAEDPLNHLLPSPGRLNAVRLPAGAGVRVDTHVAAGSDLPGAYAPLIAKVMAWGSDREQALKRLQGALAEMIVEGVPTNIPFIQRILGSAAVVAGQYDSETVHHHLGRVEVSADAYRDLAIIAALRFALRHQATRPVIPERAQSGWHRTSRRLPE